MDKKEVNRRLQQIGLRPQPAAGQHFLLDEAIGQEMVATAEVGPADTVIEVGPGLGILTQPLLATGARVIGIELDRRLAGYVSQKFLGQKNFQLIQSDIFKIDLNSLVKDFRYLVVANLPYGVTSLLFRNLLTLAPRPRRMTAMIQKEVAERMVAEPGKMSLLSLLVQHYSDAMFVTSVPKTSFWPAPEVTSAVIDVRVKNPPPDPEISQRMFQVARTAFSGRRKTLLNSLSALPPYEKVRVEKELRSVGISPTSRPQELSLEDWLKIAKTSI